MVGSQVKLGWDKAYVSLAKGPLVRVLPLVQEFQRRTGAYAIPTREGFLRGLLMAWHAADRRGRPRVLITDYLDLPTVPEFHMLADYLRAVDDAAPPLNVVPLASHGAIRCAVLGARPGPARGAALEAMLDELELALAAGAVGLSAGQVEVIEAPTRGAPAGGFAARLSRRHRSSRSERSRR